MASTTTVTFFFSFLYFKIRRQQQCAIVFYSSPFVANKASSSKLTINNDSMVFFNFRIIMARGRRLKKVGGDLDVQN
jgi:hypothetical protein